MFSTAQIERFLDESLPPDQMADIEAALRDDESLREEVAAAVGRRDAGVHSLGGIWRSHRLSCPTRSQLGSYLLEVLDEPTADYVRFHVDVVGCRCCAASLEDLREQHADNAEVTQTRRHKYFQSSAGYLSDDD